MNHPAASRPARRALRPGTVNLVIVTATIIAALGYQSASSPASSVGGPPPPAVQRPRPPAAPSPAPTTGDAPRGAGRGTTDDGDGVTEEDGALPDGVTVFDDGHSGIANLRPDLLRALREAATDAAEDGIDLHVNSGWRSAAYQERLFRDAVARYGSAQEAARWVATADTSAHVSGDAVDIGPYAATTWLAEHGSRYGLCQTYRNEAWHYELRPGAVDGGCPPMYADSAHDPNLRR